MVRIAVWAGRFLVLNATQCSTRTSNSLLKTEDVLPLNNSSRRCYVLGTQDSDYQPLQRKGHSFFFQTPYSTLPSPFKWWLVLTRYSNSTVPPNVKLWKDTRGTQHKITTFEKNPFRWPDLRELTWLLSIKAADTKAILTVSVRMVQSITATYCPW